MSNNIVKLKIGKKEKNIIVPSKWNVKIYDISDHPAISNEEVSKSFMDPIGTKKISDMINNKMKVAIICDDITRPTNVKKLLPYVLKELKNKGVPEENVEIIIALGAHRPMTGKEIEEKFGKEILKKVRILNHNPFERLVYLGETSHGTPIELNEFVANADFKIGIGCIIPHADAGFGGGGKIIMPGISSLKSIDYNHRIPGKLAEIYENENRKDIDEYAKKAGLNIIINTVINNKAETARIFIGDPIEAFREGVKIAKEMYKISITQQADVAIINAFPLDISLIVAIKALFTGITDFVKKDGRVLMSIDARDRLGYHLLSNPGGKYEEAIRERIKYVLKDKKLVIITQNLSYKEVNHIFGECKDVYLCKSFEEVIKDEQLENKELNVAVFPTAPVSLPS